MASLIILSILVVLYSIAFLMGFTDFMTGEWYYRVIYLLVFGAAASYLWYDLLFNVLPFYTALWSHSPLP